MGKRVSGLSFPWAAGAAGAVWAAVLFLAGAGVLPAVEVSELPEVLNGRPVFRIIQGDRPEYKRPGWDDSGWDRISLPWKGSEAYAFTGDPEDVYWYRLSLEFPAGLPEESLAVSLGKIADMDEAYFNGELIGRTGSFKRDIHGCNRLRIYEIPLNLIRPGEKNVLALRVRNTYRADELPGRGDFRIDEEDRLRREFYMKGFGQLFFSLLYLMMALLFFLIYYKRRQNLSTLYFGIFLLFLAVYSFTRLDIKYLFIDSFSLLQRMEFLSLYLLLPFFMAFILRYYRFSTHWVHYAFYSLSALFCAAALLISDHEARYQMNVMAVQFTWLIPLGTWGWVLAKEVRTNREARLMAGASVVIVAGVLHDTLLSRGISILPGVSVWLAPYAFFLFVISMAAIIASRHAAALREVEELNRSLEQKVKDRTKRLNRALEDIQEKDAQIAQELSLAGGVQRALLPAELPEWKRLRTAVRYEPLRDVSGDMYNFFTFPEGAAGILITDASGHGMPAAIYTILAKTAISDALHGTADPVEVFRRTNDLLCGIETSQYFTAFFIKITPDNRLIYANAGHTKALLVQPSRRRLRFLDTPGSFVGAVADMSDTYEEKETSLEPGDKVLLYTDCLLESVSGEEGKPFGEAGLAEAVKRRLDASADALVEGVYEEFRRHTGSVSLKDDLTLIGVELLP